MHIPSANSFPDVKNKNEFTFKFTCTGLQKVFHGTVLTSDTIHLQVKVIYCVLL